MHELDVNALNRNCKNQTNYLNVHIWVDLKEEMVNLNGKRWKKGNFHLDNLLDLNVQIE